MAGKQPKATKQSQPVTEGINISHWQGGFDPRLASRPLGFVIIKSSEGTAVDPAFESMYRASVGRVPVIGTYHYLRSEVDLNSQLRTVLRANAGKKIDFYAVDFEDIGNQITPGFAQQALDYARQLRSVTGKPVYLYTGQSLYEQYFSGATDVPLWLAAPTGVRVQGLQPTFVQTNFNAPGREYGVASQSVDMNVFPGSVAQLQDTLKAGANTPQVNAGGSNRFSSPGSSIYYTGSDGGLGSVVPTSKQAKSTIPIQTLSDAFGTFGDVSKSEKTGASTMPTAEASKSGSGSLLSVNLLPDNVTSFLSKPDIGVTILFFIVGLILLIVGLLMLKGPAVVSVSK